MVLAYYLDIPGNNNFHEVMTVENKTMRTIMLTLSHILVATLAAAATLFFGFGGNSSGQGKLGQLEQLIDSYFINDVSDSALYDGAAEGMVAALNDRWSYYIPASQYQAYQEQMSNSYVGIGVTITVREDETGFDVTQVEPGGSAKEAGILPGDIIVEVEGQPVAQLGTNGARDLIRGDEGTQVSIGVLRSGEKLTFTVTRKTIQTIVAQGVMLENDIGLVTIKNFDERCAEESIAAIDALVQQGAKALIFDVRNNPGGYKDDLVQVLDHLLPEGALFRSEDYAGREAVDYSDADCLELPMMVLVNENSYSAAEFFAAALNEYGWAQIAGSPTVGKGYFQSTFKLSDGSAVGLSIGKYYTPNGVSLAEEGGLVPQIQVEVDEKTAAMIYGGLLAPEEDPQIQAAVKALLDK
jgi:carboxyl-terminal processing protease